MRHYIINIGGDGREVCWKKLTHEQYEYWNDAGKAFAEEHILGPFPQEDCANNIPDFAILRTGNVGWYSLDDGGHEYYCSLDSAWFSVAEVVHCGNDVADWNRDIMLSLNIRDYAARNGLDLFEYDSAPERLEADTPYLQIHTYEKGTFITSVVSLDDGQEFDIAKVKVKVCGALDGEDVRIDAIEYDGTVLENEGAETNGTNIGTSLVYYLG